MLATRTTFRCGRDRRVRRGAAKSTPVRADGGQALHEARRHRARGFTLLEMLVVLVIAGLLVSLASLSLTRNPRTDLREEAQRIALLFETAGDEAQVRARPIAWQPTAHGFRFDVARPTAGARCATTCCARATGTVASRAPTSIIRGPTRMRTASCSAPSIIDAGARDAAFGGRQRDDRRHRQRPLRGAMTMRRRLPSSVSSSRGFTMIEVLVALAIIAVALAASIRAVGTMATNASDLHRRLLAGWSADNALAQMRLTHAWPEIGEQSFDCSQGNVQLVCTQRVSTTPNPVFRRVRISVSMPGHTGVLAQMVTVVANETSRPL